MSGNISGMNPHDVWQDYFNNNHDSVLSAGAKAAELMHISGLSLIALGRHEEAETMLSASAHAFPNPHWYANAVVQFLEAREGSRAILFGSIGLKLFPEDANLHFVTGNAYVEIERPSDAQGHFHRCLEIQPDHWEAAMNLGNDLRRSGQHVQALSFYGVALASVGGDVAGRVSILMNMAVTHSDLGGDSAALEIFAGVAKTGVVIG